MATAAKKAANDAPENDNLAIWNALGKTDPAHTKQFQRAGGFRGTALKPMWVWQRLTERFGPFGEGWGCAQPTYQLVPAGDELLVFCTVQGWHGSPENELWGVGGDKVVSMTKSGPRSDDEAFKKAFTDALMNAFKFLGAGADVHMGQFDDSKYVEALRAEFAAEPEGNGKVEGIHKIKASLRMLKTAGDAVSTLAEFNELISANKEPLQKIKDGNHEWWRGDGADFEGFAAWIKRRREELAEPAEDGMFAMLLNSMKECESLKALANWRDTNDSLIGELDGAESRRFEAEFNSFEAGLMAVAKVNAG
jgi:hypothetical protein